jgi:rhodanese-related sulfurtransferase
MTLRKLGIERVVPLRGGYEEWKRLGFSVDPWRQPIFTWPVKT